MRVTMVCALTLLATACGSAPVRAPIGSTLERPAPSPPRALPPPVPHVPDDIVERSAQPFRAQRKSDRALLEQASFFDELSRFDVICLGEAHDAPRDHFAELSISDALERRAHVSGRALGIGFEMFQTPYAAALYAYGLGRLDEAGLRRRTEYDERWGYPYAYYRPVLALGRNRGLPLKALNAPRELTHAVAETGIEALPPRLRRELPSELNMDDVAHRAHFEQLMAHHPHGAGMNLDYFYAAQVVWDETMAENAARWVAARSPSRQLVVLAGNAHCRDEAIPNRIERREPLSVASVLLDGDQHADSEGFDYALVFDPG